MKAWQRDKQWSDRFLPEIKRILGEHLIAEPPIEEDAERNTDLIVLRLDTVRVACRVRTHKHLGAYSNQFTIRSGRPSGVKTELTKVIEGWGDYLFYGFADSEGKALTCWILGDLKVFRVWFFRELYQGRRTWFEKKNTDGSSTFLAFEHAKIPDFVVASSQPYRAQEQAA